jgi:hydroxymethylglutaryl-CoA lyase
MDRPPGVVFSALVPNMKGMAGALEAHLPEIAVFAAATDSFSKRNIACNVMDSFERFRSVIAAAKAAGIRVRGYVSCALGCPYEGPVDPDAVGYVAQSLLEMGCYEISLGDTIGVGTPASVKRMLNAVKAHVPVHALALHCHDTYGQGLANVLAALEEGVATIDASVAGLGGCPYAKGASGNVATEDVVYMLHGLGVDTGVDLIKLVDAGEALCKAIGRPNRSKVAVAQLSHRAALRKGQAEVARLEAGEVADIEAAVPAGADASAAAAAQRAALSKARAGVKDAEIALAWPEPAVQVGLMHPAWLPQPAAGKAPEAN